MKLHKFQQVTVSIASVGESKRFSVETDKEYKYVKGIFISMPRDSFHDGATLGLKVNKQEVFDDAHETRLLSCDMSVAPNHKFFFFDELLEAGGSTVEGRLTDGGKTQPYEVPYLVRIYLWLTNESKPKQ